MTKVPRRFHRMHHVSLQNPFLRSLAQTSHDYSSPSPALLTVPTGNNVEKFHFLTKPGCHCRVTRHSMTGRVLITDISKLKDQEILWSLILKLELSAGLKLGLCLAPNSLNDRDHIVVLLSC